MPEKDTDVVRRLFDDVWNDRNVDLIDELLTRDCRHHDPNTPDLGTGPNAYREIVDRYTNAFPDLRLTIDDLVEAGNTVVTRWNCKGTHRGDLSGIAPTNKKVDVTGISIFRVIDGKISEEWVNWDALGMMQQLDVVPQIAKPTKKAA